MLPSLQKGIWSGKRGSNSRPPPWQGGALPLSYFRMSLAFLINDEIYFNTSLDVCQHLFFRFFQIISHFSVYLSRNAQVSVVPSERLIIIPSIQAIVKSFFTFFIDHSSAVHSQQNRQLMVTSTACQYTLNLLTHSTCV